MEKEQNITLREIVREHLLTAKWSLVVSGLSLLGFTLTELISPWPLKIIFDHILLDKSLPEWLGWVIEKPVEKAVAVENIVEDKPAPKAKLAVAVKTKAPEPKAKPKAKAPAKPAPKAKVKPAAKPAKKPAKKK